AKAKHKVAPKNGLLCYRYYYYQDAEQQDFPRTIEGQKFRHMVHMGRQSKVLETFFDQRHANNQGQE
ncbi:MAG: hypothetical protein ACLP2X_15705, partial [Syntrophobacteraceae bacterium]